MSEHAKKARQAMKEKISRLVRTDPKKTVDASGYTPPDALDADVKTGMRPISRRQFKKGGKVLAVHGEHARHHAGKKPRRAHKAMGGDLTRDKFNPSPETVNTPVPANPRYGAEAVQKAIDSSNRSGRKISKGEAAKIHRLLRGGYKSGGKAITADSLINRNVREANEKRDGYKHVGGFKRGGRTHKMDGGSFVPTNRMAFSPTESRMSKAAGLKKGGAAKHDDVAEDTKLVKKLVKPDALKDHPASCRCSKCGGGRAGRKHGGKAKHRAEGGVNWSENENVNVPPELHSPTGPDPSYRPLPPLPKKNPLPPKKPIVAPAKKRGGSLSVSDGSLEGTRPTGGRLARKAGGRAKGKTSINIIIGTGHRAPMGPAGMMPPAGPDGGPVGLRQGLPPAGSQGPAGAPSMPMPPPGAVGPAGAPPMPPMGRRTGGRVKYPIIHASGGGLGRLEKIKAYGKEAGPVVGKKQK